MGTSCSPCPPRPLFEPPPRGLCTRRVPRNGVLAVFSVSAVSYNQQVTYNQYAVRVRIPPSPPYFALPYDYDRSSPATRCFWHSFPLPALPRGVTRSITTWCTGWISPCSDKLTGIAGRTRLRAGERC